MNSARAALVVSFAVGLPVVAHGQANPVSIENIVSRGQTVTVVQAGGTKVRGRVAEASSTRIVLLTPDRREFEMETVARITRSDSVWNGVVIGAAAGLAPAIGIWIAGACGGGYANSNRNCMSGAALLAAGAIGGAAIDAAITKTVYRAARTRVEIIPNLSRSRSSLSVAIGF